MNNHKDILRHTAIWIVYYGLLYLLFEGKFTTSTALMSAFTLWFLHVIGNYTNTLVLVPRYYQSKKYLFYIVLLIGLLILITYFFNLITSQFQDFEQFRNNLTNRSGSPIGRFIPILWVTLLVLLISTLYSITKLNTLREKEAAMLKSENLTAELNFLRSQINPHFLFNAMNNLYALSIDKSPHTSDMILNLSAMLRYNLYDAESKLTSISQEIDYLTNYLEFFKIRIEEPTAIIMTSNIDRSHQIAPMLLIPFVENAIKHSKIENDSKAYISIFLECTDNNLLFKVINTVPSGTHQKDKLGGIGIKNVRRRLELLYKDRHELSIHETKNEYVIDLTISLKN